MSLKLWLIRHGETDINKGLWSNKPAEANLTDQGKAQAEAAASKLTQAPDLIIMSPLKRAKDSAAYLLQKWPETPSCIWPIQELIYLSPTKLEHLSQEERKESINRYWQNCDPTYCDDVDTESFESFLKRAEHFYHQITPLQGFVVVVGHGQFFKAFQLGLNYGFTPSAEWMKLFRQQEVTNPIKNGEIVQMDF